MKTRNRLALFGAALMLLSTTAGPASAVPLANLELWVKADAGVEISAGVPATTTGDTAAIWKDQSGNANDLAVPPSNPNFNPVAPQYLTGAVNGEPVVRFSIGNQSLQAPAALVSGAGDFSVFAVFAAGPGTFNERVVGGTYGFYTQPPTNTEQGMKINIYTDNARSYISGDGYLIGGTTVDDSVFYILQVERVSGTTTIRINNVVDASGAQTASLSAAYRWTIGTNADYNGNASATADLQLAEELVYTDSLDASNRRDAVAYLAQKYNIAAADIPEPASLALIVIGAGLTLSRPRVRSGCHWSA